MNVEPKEFINDVIRAYAKTKLVPGTGRMFRYTDGHNCACALGVLYAVENGIPDINNGNCYFEVWDWAKNKFGEMFVETFWRGFDNGKTHSDSEIDDLAVETRNKVFELYNKGELYG